MPWSNPNLEEIIKEAKKKINDLITEVEITAITLVANAIEMKKEILTEGKLLKLPEKEMEDRIFLSEFTVGKYFKLKNEIWLVEGKGENSTTIIHEYLHSIQKCEPNREKIVEYITYKITGEEKGLSNAFIKEWEEIEKKEGFQKIINRLVNEGDCEDF